MVKPSVMAAHKAGLSWAQTEPLWWSAVLMADRSSVALLLSSSCHPGDAGYPYRGRPTVGHGSHAQYGSGGLRPGKPGWWSGQVSGKHGHSSTSGSFQKQARG